MTTSAITNRVSRRVLQLSSRRHSLHKSAAPFVIVHRHFSKDNEHDEFQKQMMELQEEREALFGFSNEERSAWSKIGENNNNDIADSTTTSSTTVASFLQQHGVTEDLSEEQVALNDELSQDTDADDSSPVLTHLSNDQSSVHMVDVGSKATTKRVARARSKVVFPPEVMVALSTSKNEMVSAKGPIFATAKLAGIMAAKRTSDLIPLCHPLPLDKVHVDITLHDNTAVIECECRVTHRTGVEMEALLGASVAALTIYDMVKAVSHEVRIEETVLLSKKGGKRTVG